MTKTKAKATKNQKSKPARKSAGKPTKSVSQTDVRNAKPKLYRQGDVFIAEVASIPDGAKVIERGPKEDIILAHGEVTGHAHRIPSRHANLLRTEEDVRYMRVMGPAPVMLNHEEHSTVTLPPGNYRVTIHTEYQPGELPRQVVD